jgi:hypothetical protein
LTVDRRVSPDEIWLLSYYAASELVGGLLFGKLARWTSDPSLRARLTWHCAEETRHAWAWTETVLDVGGSIVPVDETYQSEYLREAGLPRGEVELLALTQVFEQRVARHFAAHLRCPALHPRVQQTLRQMIQDEGSHLGWVRDRLGRNPGDASAVARELARFAEIDRRVYARQIARFRGRPGLRPLVAVLAGPSEEQDDL